MKILFNCVDLNNKSGGIARTAKVVENYLNKKLSLDVYLNSLNGVDKNYIKSKKIFNSHNNKILFTVKNNYLQLFSDKIIYYHPALIRAHLNKKKKYLSFIFGIDVWNIKNISRFILIKRSQSIFACSNFTIKKTEEIFKEKIVNAQCIWPGTDTNEVPKKTNKRNSDTFNILILGRIVDQLKGHVLLLDSLKQLIIEFKHLRLIIVGEGEYKKSLELLVKKNKLENFVTFKGFVEENELDKIWSRTDLFVMPSKTEGFGLVYVEAMRQGITVICSNQDAGCEININGQTGFNVDLNLKNDLTSKIAKVIINKQMKKKMGINSQNLWKTKFNLKAYEERIENILLPNLT